MAACSGAAEAYHGATCRFGVDVACRSAFGYECRCLCDGYWECDAIKIVCDPDAGTPGD